MFIRPFGRLPVSGVQPDEFPYGVSEADCTYILILAKDPYFQGSSLLQVQSLPLWS